MKRNFMLPILLLMVAALPTACNVQKTENRGQPQDYSYQGQEANWTGPGRYYGVYFSHERKYRDWHRSRRGHGGQYRHRGDRGHGGRHGGGRHHGGRRH